MAKLKLDRLDINILASLQRNGRITNTDLSDLVGLSPSPCLARVKRLEKNGYIKGYNARIALEMLGETATIFTEITLDDHHPQGFDKFERKIKSIDEVVECHLVSGGYDYLLKFITPGISQYQELIEDILQNDFGITKYFSYVVLKSCVEKAHYPLAKLYNVEN